MPRSRSLYRHVSEWVPAPDGADAFGSGIWLSQAGWVEVGSVGYSAGAGVRAFDDEVAEVASFAIAPDQIADVLACRPVAVVGDPFIKHLLAAAESAQQAAGR